MFWWNLNSVGIFEEDLGKRTYSKVFSNKLRVRSISIRFFFSVVNFTKYGLPFVWTSELRLRVYVIDDGKPIIHWRPGVLLPVLLSVFFVGALFLGDFFTHPCSSLTHFFWKFQEYFLAEVLFALFILVIFFTCFMLFGDFLIVFFDTHWPFFFFTTFFFK